MALDLPRPEDAPDAAVRYGRGLLEHLPGLLPGVALRFYGPLASLASLSPLDRVEPIRTDRDLLDRTRTSPPDLHHAIAPLGSVARAAALRAARRAVLTLLDLPGAERFPAGADPAGAVRQSIVLRAAARWASRVVVPTESLADAAALALDLPRERLVVLPPGIDVEPPIAAGDAGLDLVRARHGLGKRYVLWAGVPEETASFAQLVAGLLAAAEHVPGADLVFADRTSRPAAPSFLMQELRRMGLGPRLKLLEATTKEEWRLLARAALAVVVPDGGGTFPYLALEAMAAEAAVVCADSALHREVLGDAALRFDAAVGASLGEILEALTPGEREALAHAGRRHAQGFTRAACARRVAALYAELLEREPSARDLEIPKELVAVAPGELTDLEPLLVPHRRGSATRVLLALGARPSHPESARFADPDDVAAWHLLVAMAARSSGPDLTVVPVDASLAPLPGALETLATVAGASRVDLLGSAADEGGADGRPRSAGTEPTGSPDAAVQASSETTRLALPDDPELLASHPRHLGLVAYRLAGRMLPGFPGELRSVWLGRSPRAGMPRFAAPSAALVHRALKETEGTSRGIPTLLLFGPGAITPELVDAVSEALQEKGGRYRAVLPLLPAEVFELETSLKSASRTWVAGAVLEDGPRAGEATALLRREGLRVCLRVVIGAGSGAARSAAGLAAADLRALAAEVLRIRAVGADDVLPRLDPVLPGLGDGVAETVVHECRRRLSGDALVELERELMEARIELGRARRKGVSADRADDGHRACRAELRDVSEAHRRAVELLEAYVSRLKRSLARLLAAEGSRLG